MIESVIQGIVDQLHDQFGDSVRYYTESVTQNLHEPAFLIRCLDPAQNREIGRRFSRTHQFSVQYIPESTAFYGECYGISDQLFECLSEISINYRGSEFLIHGSNLIGQVSDGVLTFTVNYDFPVIIDAESEIPMGDVVTEVDVIFEG